MVRYDIKYRIEKTFLDYTLYTHTLYTLVTTTPHYFTQSLQVKIP